MLAVVRNFAFSVAIVMAGLLAVMVAEYAWAALFLLDGPPPMFDQDFAIGGSGYTEGSIAVAVMIWLVGRMVRRASKSIAVGR